MLTALRARAVSRTIVRSAKSVKPARRLASTTAGPGSAGVGYAVAGGLTVASGAAGYAIASRSGAVAEAKTSPPPDSSVPSYGTKEDYQKAVKELKEAFGNDEERVTTDDGDLQTHGFAEHDPHPGFLHTVLVYPRSTEDVVKVVKIADKYRMPIIPYSGGTSLEGQTRGHDPTGGISLDMSQMDKIIAINAADSDVILQPGVGYVELNEELKSKGLNLFLPLDPGPGATVGGMFNTGCSGTNAVRYGTARAEWFINATIVLPSGEVIKTRQRARKSSAGFDTTKLFIGSEGTLGIVTELTVRLAPLLPTSVAVVAFPDVRAAVAASTDIVNAVGAGIQCIELCDNDFMRATNLHGAAKRKYAEKDSLYLKFQGPTDRAIEEAAGIARGIAEKYGGSGFEFAQSKEDAEELWQDRKNALWSGMALAPGSKAWSTDVCVPVSRLPDLVLETKADIQKSGIISSIVGHVGDGNFHSLLLFKDEHEHEIATELVHRMVERAIGMDGTCTGEHGVGMGKKEYLTQELGHGTVAFMKLLKRTIDPKGIMNPGKLYPDDDGPGHIKKISDQVYKNPKGEKE